MNTTPLTPFNGSDYDHDRDAPRLTEQIQRVFTVLSDRNWHALSQIAGITGDPEASISAQIRHLRKSRFGGWAIEKKHASHGLYLYRLTGERANPASQPPSDPIPLPPAAPELLKAAEIRIAQLEGQVEDLESFHCDVIAGCDISKGSQGLFRQCRVIIGPGKTQDQIDLEIVCKELGQIQTELVTARAKCDALTAVLESIIRAVPAGASEGDLFYEHFDGEGNYAGYERVDPISIIGAMAGLAEEGLAAAARLDPQISPQNPTENP